jgi:hypothetical protein
MKPGKPRGLEEVQEAKKVIPPSIFEPVRNGLSKYELNQTKGLVLRASTEQRAELLALLTKER